MKRSCRDCRYVLKYTPKGEIQSQLLCRHSPPLVVGLPVQQGRQVTVALQSADRPVGPDYWCHQFAARELWIEADGKSRVVPGELAPMDEESGNAVS